MAASPKGGAARLEGPTTSLTADGPAASSRSKRHAILEAAIEAFGDIGFEATRWGDIADQVGIREPALYHYFVSKTHSLLTIMRLQLTRNLERFREIVAIEPDVSMALRHAIEGSMNVDDREIMRLRVLVANLSLLTTQRKVAAEELERRASRRLVQEIEEAWGDLLNRGMADGRFVRCNSRHEALAVLGLINSVWRWYRPGPGLAKDELASFYADCALRMVEVRA